VQFGATPVEGTVLDAYDIGFGGQVMIALELTSVDEPFTVTYDVDAVELAA
jgi:hypothetical protein